MKKVLSLFLMCALCLTLFGCIDLSDVQSDYQQPISGNIGNLEDVSNSEDTGNSTNTKNNEPVHNHTWVNATCTAAKTCSACGVTDGEAAGHNWTAANCTDPKTCTRCHETDGKANGHNWKDATCSTPKTCTTCGTTSGSTAGHTFSSGKCTQCGKSDPAYTTQAMVWIPTKGGKKYHSNKGCSNMDGPDYVTKTEAESLGFTPCKRCY